MASPIQGPGVGFINNGNPTIPQGAVIDYGKGPQVMTPSGLSPYAGQGKVVTAAQQAANSNPDPNTLSWKLTIYCAIK